MITKWIKAKTFDGIPHIASVDIRDNQLHGITFDFGGGSVVRVAKQDFSSMAILVPAPAEVKDVWTLSGALAGVSVNESFDAEHKADSRASELRINGFEVVVTKESVTENAAGSASLEAIF